VEAVTYWKVLRYLLVSVFVIASLLALAFGPSYALSGHGWCWFLLIIPTLPVMALALKLLLRELDDVIDDAFRGTKS
jgi:hypothetical protein